MSYARPHKALGARLHAARVKQNLSRADVARLLGVHVVTVQGWEVGRHRPPPSDLAAIAAATGMTVYCLRIGGRAWDAAITAAPCASAFERRKPAVTVLAAPAADAPAPLPHDDASAPQRKPRRLAYMPKPPKEPGTPRPSPPPRAQSSPEAMRVALIGILPACRTSYGCPFEHGWCSICLCIVDNRERFARELAEDFGD